MTTHNTGCYHVGRRRSPLTGVYTSSQGPNTRELPNRTTWRGSRGWDCSPSRSWNLEVWLVFERNGRVAVTRLVASGSELPTTRCNERGPDGPQKTLCSSVHRRGPPNSRSLLTNVFFGCQCSEWSRYTRTTMATTVPPHKRADGDTPL